MPSPIAPLAQPELKVEIVRQELTNVSLAAAVGCVPATISQIIRGRLVPSDDLKRRIAEHLGRSVDELFREPIDYRAEYRRLRLAHGLDPDVPEHVRDAVAALLPPENS
jgi:transcriptional regulator with XRE-family HTH domain